MYQRVQHFGVYGLIMKDEKVLLVKKSKGLFKGLWDFPGGKIEFGEAPDTALIREIMEETGLEIESYAYLKSDAAVVHETSDEGIKETIHQVGFIYRVEVKSFDSLTIEGDEENVESAEWFDMNAIELDDFTPFVQEIMLELPIKDKIRKKN